MPQETTSQYDIGVNVIAESCLKDLNMLMLNVQPAIFTPPEWKYWLNLMRSGVRIITCFDHNDRIVGLALLSTITDKKSLLHDISIADHCCDDITLIKEGIIEAARKDAARMQRTIVTEKQGIYTTKHVLDTDYHAIIHALRDHERSDLVHRLDLATRALIQDAPVQKSVIHALIRAIEKVLAQKMPADRIQRFRAFLYGMTGRNITLAAQCTT